VAAFRSENNTLLFVIFQGYRILSLPKRGEVYLEPLIERAQAGVAAVAKAVKALSWAI
jgi:hypothetical protein